MIVIVIPGTVIGIIDEGQYNISHHGNVTIGNQCCVGVLSLKVHQEIPRETDAW